MPTSKFPEIIGEYVDLAHLVRSITGQVPRETAAKRSGVSHDTIARLWRGERANGSTLLRFAAGYRVNPNPLLRAAGLPEMPEGTYVVPGNHDIARDDVEFEHAEAIPVPDGYEDLSPEARAAAMRAAREAFRSVADVLLQHSGRFQRLPDMDKANEKTG